MTVADQLASLLFEIGITLVAIVPRLPNDKPFPFSIGGDLSYNFRRALLLFLFSNVVRILFFEDSRFLDGTVTSDKKLLIRLNATVICRGLESFLLAFLCLLTPYLMQCQLQNRINISQPGRDLMQWIYLVVAFTSTGCILVELTDNTSYWCIKKVGDALSFPPIYKTLKLYSSITTPGGKYPGRGDLTVQTLFMMEYLAVIAAFLSAVGYFMIKDPRPIFEALRHLGAYAQLVRLLCHAMLMNSKDEADYYAKFSTTTASSYDDDVGTGGGVDDQNSKKSQSIALIRSA